MVVVWGHKSWMMTGVPTIKDQWSNHGIMHDDWYPLTSDQSTSHGTMHEDWYPPTNDQSSNHATLHDYWYPPIRVQRASHATMHDDWYPPIRNWRASHATLHANWYPSIRDQRASHVTIHANCYPLTTDQLSNHSSYMIGYATITMAIMWVHTQKLNDDWWSYSNVYFSKQVSTASFIQLDYYKYVYSHSKCITFCIWIISKRFTP